MNRTAFYDELIEKAKANPIGFVQRHYRLMLALTALVGLIASLLGSVALSAGVKLALDGQNAFGNNDLETFEISHLILFFWVILWFLALLLIERLHSNFRSVRRRKGEGLDVHFAKALEIIEKNDDELPLDTRALVVDDETQKGRPSLSMLLLTAWGAMWAFFFLPLSSFSMGWIGVWSSHIAFLSLFLAFYLDKRVHPLILLLIPPMCLSWLIIALSFYPTAIVALLPIVYIGSVTLHRIYVQIKRPFRPALLCQAEEGLFYIEDSKKKEKIEGHGPFLIRAEGYETELELQGRKKVRFTFRCRQELDTMFGNSVPFYRRPFIARQGATLAAVLFLFISAFIAPSSFIATTTAENLISKWNVESRPTLAQTSRMCMWLPISQGSHALYALSAAEEGLFEKASNSLERFEWLRGEQVPALYGLESFHKSGCKTYCRRAADVMKTKQANFHKAHQLIRLAEMEGNRLPSRLTINELVQKMLVNEDDRASQQLYAYCLGRIVWTKSSYPDLPPQKADEWAKKAIALLDEIGFSGAEKGYIYFRNERFTKAIEYLAQSPEERELLLRASAMRFTQCDLQEALALLEKCQNDENRKMLSALIHGQLGNHVLASSILKSLGGSRAKLLELMIAHQNGQTLPGVEITDWPLDWPVWLADVDLEYIRELEPKTRDERDAENLRIFLNPQATHAKKNKRGFPRLATLKWYPYYERASLETKLRLEGVK